MSGIVMTTVSHNNLQQRKETLQIYESEIFGSRIDCD